MLRQLTTLIAFAFVTLTVSAQMPSMNISHQGLQPNDTLWVAPGDSILFIHGGGGPHPMTSGHGMNPSPVFFPTVSVTVSVPTAVFTLDSVGTYLFHCGTNPSNNMNWGTIIVDPAYANMDEQVLQGVKLYPNPIQDVLKIHAPLRDVDLELIGFNGQVVMHRTLALGENSMDVSGLAAGTYTVRLVEPHGERYSEEIIVNR